MNERNTENIIRNELRKLGYYDDNTVIIEEQKSNIPRINKALENASKKGTGRGYPEFIISFTDDANIVLVVECKADITKHESINKTNYSDYAVDGALLYASYLAKEYTVIAIAISGETLENCKISTFVQLKESVTSMNKDINKILNKESYLDLFNKTIAPLTPEFLLKKAKYYNDMFHSYSIPETERCTFISSILVALQDADFRLLIPTLPNKRLVDELFNACGRVLVFTEKEEQYKHVITTEYSKIRHNVKLTSDTIQDKKLNAKPNTILKDLIIDLQNNILPYMLHNNTDILGQFYTEFIKYAGSDSKTGLVLTPHHITDFFCDLVDLKKDDVVFDPCCGTGGFLVSALKRMLSLANHDLEEQKKIKKDRLLGIELRADMFTHTCSNMMMRGDGKSNIQFGSCFDPLLLENVRKAKPNVAFLNPPYDVGETSQLKFIENALDQLKKRGLCVSICQMSTVIANNKANIVAKQSLLKKHTLKAVFSMPSDLFYPVGVVTAIIIFEAGIPHNPDVNVFFGYLKEDGHELSKQKGRVDKGQWGGIKDNFLDLYRNKKSVAGLSVMQKVNYQDEWCAEAYMETDYSDIVETNFIENIEDFIASTMIKEGR